MVEDIQALGLKRKPRAFTDRDRFVQGDVHSEPVRSVKIGMIAILSGDVLRTDLAPIGLAVRGDVLRVDEVRPRIASVVDLNARLHLRSGQTVLENYPRI